jgi:hypothetical protein
LQLDKSDRAAVIAFAGPPAAERRGQEPTHAPYDALGYGCSRLFEASNTPLVQGGPYCRTVFFLNNRTGRLETFFTTAVDYSESHGVRIGMATAAAERLLHKRLLVGCDKDIYLSSPKAYLTVAFIGGRIRPHSRSVLGGHVYAFVLHSNRNEPGVFDCL